MRKFLIYKRLVRKILAIKQLFIVVFYRTKRFMVRKFTIFMRHGFLRRVSCPQYGYSGFYERLCELHHGFEGQIRACRLIDCARNKNIVSRAIKRQGAGKSGMADQFGYCAAGI